MANITLEELTNELKYRKIYATEQREFNNIKIDSRNIEKGDIFIALIGKNHDAHKFLDDVFKRGAGLAIVQKETKYPHILVDDTLMAFKAIAGYMLKKSNAKSIAVTGSTGKTTTKELICSILENRRCHKTHVNENNVIGVSKTLINIGKNEVCVVEVGTNHIGEMAEISTFFKPDIAVFTNIGNSHLKHFHTKNNILKEKLSILANKTYPVFNYDDVYLRKALNKKGTSCSLINPQADVYIKDVKKNHLVVQYLSKEFTLKPPESVNLYNILLSVAASFIFSEDITQDEIDLGFKNFKHQNLRMQKEFISDTEFILDCYNANPDSVKYAISVFAKKTGKKLVVLGDMLELGDLSEKLHRDIGSALLSLDMDLIAFGNDAYYIYDEAKKNTNGSWFFDDKSELILFLKDAFKNYDSILIKGSRGMKMEEIFYTIKGE